VGRASDAVQLGPGVGDEGEVQLVSALKENQIILHFAQVMRLEGNLVSGIFK
jgi:hypothetical protein